MEKYVLMRNASYGYRDAAGEPQSRQFVAGDDVPPELFVELSSIPGLVGVRTPTGNVPLDTLENENEDEDDEGIDEDEGDEDEPGGSLPVIPVTKTTTTTTTTKGGKPAKK